MLYHWGNMMKNDTWPYVDLETTPEIRIRKQLKHMYPQWFDDIGKFRILASMPLAIELSSNMHLYYAFGHHIYSLSSQNTYALLVRQTYFDFSIYCNNWTLYKHMYNTHEMLS